MRYIALDLGDKRTGVAVGDAETGIVSPVEVIDVPVNPAEPFLAAVARVVADHLGGGRGDVVVGLPLNMDDTEGPRAKAVRALAERIAEATGRRVHLQDERLSSATADWTMAQSGLTRGQKKQRRDALAAAAILRDFLASHNIGGT